MKRLLCITAFLLTGLCACTNQFRGVAGQVVDEAGLPIADAVVRVQTTENSTITDEMGNFYLENVTGNEEVFITAWKSGYFIVGAPAKQGANSIIIKIHTHSAEDNQDYEWLSSEYFPGENEHQVCAVCHSKVGTQETISLPVDEWLLDAHSQSAKNPRFLTMYNGTDVSGHLSPITQYAKSRDYGEFPLPPDLSKPYYGPGYKLDFPETDGNCAACHTPAASVNSPYGVNPTMVEGVAAEGVPCDFCHKIWEVNLDQKTQLPLLNMPGVLSYEFRRPFEGHQFFAGPLDDVAPGEDTYSPIQQESAFCAPCHHAIFWDTLIYNSYGEWLDSPYSNPETGQTCQDCHMPPLGNDHFARIEVGGLIRNPETIFSHKMLGASDVEFLQNTAELNAEAYIDRDKLIVDVQVENTLAGHHIPTDSPLRQILLVVEAVDQNGKKLNLYEGPVLPEWTGDLANKPGKYYAKILEQLWTEVSPTGAYWSQTRILEDTRLAAFQVDTSSFEFEIPEESEDFIISVKLIFRRAFYDLMEQKGWDTPDIEMEIVTLDLSKYQ